MSGSGGPRKRENPETELHQVPGTTPGAAGLSSVLPCLLCSGGESGGMGRGFLSYFPVRADSPSDTRSAPGPAPSPFALSAPPLRDPQPPVPSHLTWPRHPAHPRHSLTNWGPGNRLLHAHWRGFSSLPAPLDSTACHSALRAPPPGRFKLL